MRQSQCDEALCHGGGQAVVPAELKMSSDVDMASLVKSNLLSPVPVSFYEAATADLAQR